MISRYLLLLLFNLPFIMAAILNVITQYKLKRLKKSQLFTRLFVWFAVLFGLVFAEPFYIWLYSNGLTASDSLSLFDVVQITAIVILFYVINRARLKLEVVERRLKHLHQELSISTSEEIKNDSKK